MSGLHEISFSDETFLFILGSADTDALEMTGSEMARKHFPLAPELYRSNRHPLAFREFVTEVLGKHAGWSYVEVHGKELSGPR